jgi:protein transport protein SEC31
MLVREVNRSAALAWGPLGHRPHLLAAATLAGTMNVDFDPSGKLEIFDISDKASRGLKDPLDMPLIGLTSTSERLHRLAWRNPLPNTFADGLIVGGLGSGAINIWNPTPLIEYVN